MTGQSKPKTYSMDLIGGNGTPFRFTYWPDTDRVAYQDRRHPTQPGEPHYQPFFNDENGQNCGPALDSSSFIGRDISGIRGWHGVDDWDLDRRTVVMVGDWLTLLKESGA